MARPRKSPITPAATTMTTHEINISDYCKAQNLSEQQFRLVLEGIRPDDFDVTKTVSRADLDYVLATLPAPNNSQQIAGSPTPQALDPKVVDSTTNNSSESSETEPQQGLQANNAIVANSGNGGISKNQQVSQGSNITLLDELIAASEEEIKLADLVAQFKNQQILANSQARDAQLVEQLRHQRLNTRAGYFDALRGLQATTIEKPEPTPDDINFDGEVTRLSNELGKSLVISN